MALKTYIGARYAPKFMGAWNKSNEYAALSVVYHDNQSYVSRQTVPADTEITNTQYWFRSSDWNAQVDEYRNQVNAYDEKVVQYNQNVEAYNASANQFFDETIHAYNTKEDMVNDESVKVGYTLITCGETAIGDGGGSFYQVVSETSSGAVALKNGLFAKKFQLMPERFNRWTVENISALTNMSLSVGDEVNFIGDFANQPTFGYDLSGNEIYLAFSVKSAFYMGTTENVTDPGDNSFMKFNDDNKVFKIGRVEPYLRHNVSSILTLLNYQYGYNYAIITTSLGVVHGGSFIIGKSDEYYIKFQGDSASSKTIKVKSPLNDDFVTVNFTPLPCDYYVSLRSSGSSITATVYPVGGQNIIGNIGSNSSTTSGTFELAINKAGSFYEPVVIPTGTMIFNIKYPSAEYNVDSKDNVTLLTTFIPFINSSEQTLTINFNASGIFINNILAPLITSAQYAIPTGRSFWMFILKIRVTAFVTPRVTIVAQQLG